MKVLLTAPSLDLAFGGPAAKLHALRSALARSGTDVRVMAASRPGSLDGLPAWLRFHGTPVPLRLDRIVAAVREADLVHVLGYRDPVGSAAALAARMSGVPYLLEPAGMFHRRLRSLRLKSVFDRSIGRIVVGGARFLIATSRAEAAEILQGGVPGARVVIRPNGVDLEQFGQLPPRGAFRRSLGIPDGKILVLALGRMTRKKGLPELIRAAQRVPDLVLVITGPDDRDGTLERVRSLAEAAAPRVRLLPGGMFGTARMQALADADLFCLYSMSENFGSAAAEAAAAGVATIVSDRCGVGEWMTDGLEIVTWGDTDALAERLRELASDPVRRAALAARGRQAARQLAWPAVAASQLELYRRAPAEQ